MMIKILLKSTKCLKSLKVFLVLYCQGVKKQSDKLLMLEGKSFVAVAMAKMCQKNESGWF